jgi:hypothetical protein
MAGLAHGGHAPVIIPILMGGSALIIGATIDSLYGLIPFSEFFVLCSRHFSQIFGETLTARFLVMKVCWSVLLTGM